MKNILFLSLFMMSWTIRAYPESSASNFSVTPVYLDGKNGAPTALDVESTFYRIHFDLAFSGAASSTIYKPLNHEFRAERELTENFVFQDSIGYFCPAKYHVLKQDAQELVLEFELQFDNKPQHHELSKVMNRRRVHLLSQSPVIRVE